MVEDVAEALRAGRREDLIAGYGSPQLWKRIREAPHSGPALAAVAERAGRWAHAGPEPLPFSLYRRFAEDGSRAPFEDVYFRRRRNRLTDLALSALAHPHADLGPLEDLVWAVCDEYTWCVPAHIDGLLDPSPASRHPEQIDLFAAETAFTLAELRHLFAGRLSPLVGERIRHEVNRRVLRPVLTHPAPWWESARTNWAAVCAGSVGMAALHLLDDTPERPGDGDALTHITTRMIEAMGCFLAGYGDDGACPEGLAYWSYGFGFFTVYADALLRRTGGRIDLFDDPTGKVEEIARFPERVFLSGTATAAFSDTPPHSLLDPGLAARLRRRFPSLQPPPQDRLATEPVNSMGSWPTALRSLVWAAESQESRPAASGPPAAGSSDRAASGHYFPDVQWMIASATAAGRQVAFAAKAGHNDELHNHNDLGSFVLAVDGEPLLAELGQGFYSGRYFGPERYDILCTGSQGHSVPLIDGTTQRASRQASARVLKAQQEPGHCLFRLDIASAYPVPTLTSVVREFTFADGRLTLRDRITADSPVDVTERFMSFVPVVLDAPGRATVRGARAALRLSYDADAWEARIVRHAHTLRDGSVTTVHSLDLRRTSAEACLDLRARPVPAG
ncbi:heparinase II/III domain-containing protein [Streptomyces sp. enrichment culture]|uniref:heparinase II/III domain-containing protein n=1 Tax=Streptomyces sp. enrichment culture TaxID=1795815 RepID=UPI003F5785FA